MRISSSAYALGIAAATTLLAGCGPGVPLQPGSASIAAASPRRTTSNNAWLYVADDPFSVGIVYIFGFPDPNRTRVKAIEHIGYAYGPCADASGHVWVPAVKHSVPGVLEFRAGGTKTIGRLDVPSGTGIGECALDPVTGNLAVLGTHSVNIFPKAKGKSTNYALGAANVMACAYDGEGNLFVDGMKSVSTSFQVFVLYELPKGGKTFSSITLDKRAGFAGGLEWDGQYVAVATGGDGVNAVIYRFTVSGTKGTVVQAVHPDSLSYDAWFAVADGDIIGTSGTYGPRLRLWSYPGGGKWIWELGPFQTQGIAIATVP